MAFSLVRRSLATLAVVNYLLAVTVGGWFHDHGPSASSVCAGCQQPQHHGDRDHRSGDRDEPGGCTGQSVCLICRFLAEKPIPPAATEAALVRPLAVWVTFARAIAAPVAVVSLEDIRGPPSIA